MTPAVNAVEKGGVHFSLHRYQSAAGVDNYGREAAEALGIDPRRVYKTLLVLVDDIPQVAMVPVDRTLSLKALAKVCGGKKAAMADGALAQRLTGYVLGGISPLGQRTRLPLWLDDSADDLATLYMSAGRRGLEIEMTPADLLSLAGGRLAPLAR